MASAPAPSLRFLTRWTSRDSLASPALAPGYAPLDARDLARRAADMVHFSASMPFVGPSDNEDGTWDEMFTGDEAVLLALIATMDVEGASAEAEGLIRRIWRDHDFERQELLLRELAHLLLRLAARMDRWLGSAEGHAPGGASRHLFERLVGEVFGPRFRRLLALLRRIEDAGFFKEEVIVVVEGCRSIWFVEVDFELDLWEGEGWIERLVHEVLDAATAFIAAVRELVEGASAALERSLEQPTHPPHVALLFAYGQVLGNVQDKVNALPSRLGDYYRESVLRYAPEPAQPDTVLLALAPIPVRGAPAPRVPKGTDFPAGRGADGQPVVFASDAPLTVTGARLLEIRAWQVERSGEHVTRVGVQSFPLAADGAAAAAFAPGQTLPDAQIGLEVASRLLDLPSGRREVSLRFRQLDCAISSSSAEDVTHCFALSVSSGNDWMPVPGFSAELSPDAERGGDLCFSFTLDEDFPPLAAALRLMLVQEAAVAGTPALELFGSSSFAGVSLDVTVTGLGGLGVTTPDGLSGAAPGLAPFGTAPIPGATLRIEHPAFALPLLSLTLELEWNGLPTGREGFADYYRQYVVGPDRRIVNPYRHPLLTNESFRVDLCAPVGAAGWEVKDEMLFRWDEAGTLCPTSIFDVPLDGAAEAPCPDRALTLALAAPPLGFGDVIYPVNVAHATAVIGERAERRDWLVPLLLKIIALLLKPFKAAWGALKKGGSEAKAFITGHEPPEDTPAPESKPPSGHLSPAASLPNPPWRPTLADVRVSYKAGTDGGVPLELFHIAAVGERTAVALTDSTALLPPLPDGSACDIRISGWDGEDPLSLLFLLGSADPAAAAAGVRWTWWIGAAWGPLPAARDGTSALTATGILTLPPLPTGGADLWLRASLEGAPPAVARILANAVSATRIVAKDESAVAPVAPDTVRSPAGLAGIARVAQPLASFGGRGAADETDMLQHLAGRIATRARAVLEDDVERLLFERFPGIARVRLFPAADEAGQSAAGAVRLVVVPEQGGPTPPDPVRPHAPPELRGAIAAWLGTVSSPFSRPIVEDPAYAEIDLQIAASFEDASAGPDRLRAEVEALLSPWAEPGPDLEDGAGMKALEAAVARFVASRPYVLALISVSAAAGPAPAPLAVPVPGKVDILAVQGPGSGC